MKIQSQTSFLKDFHQTRGGWIVAILSGLLISAFFFYIGLPSPANLKVEIVNITSFTALNENVPGLEVFWNKEKLQQNEESLSIVTLKFSNPGKQGIEPGMYDQKKAFGIIWPGATIYDPQVIDASELHLKDNVSPTKIDKDGLQFSPVAIDGKAWFTLKTVVIHPINAPPKLALTGKISNIDFESNLIEDISKGPQKKDIFERLPLWIQALIYILIIVGQAMLVHSLFTTIKLEKKIDNSFDSLLDFKDLEGELHSMVDGLKRSKVLSSDQIKEWRSLVDSLKLNIQMLENNLQK